MSKVNNMLRIHIIEFTVFRRTLLEEYTEEELRYFFQLFPYTMDTELNSELMEVVVRQEIEHQEDFQVITIHGKDYVLVDENSDILEPWSLLEKIEGQPIPLEKFVPLVLEDIIIMDTESLLDGVKANLRKTDKTEKKAKYVEASLKDGVYI
ncbi:MAG: hypothetical protein EU535_06355 [Promethearchaeota archaeon]|nr:MAG: hypothetical protein EU535_06355 [Candidatus Lokiarchaeota archaeon]